MANDQDTFHADLHELLTILGMGDHSRPQSPHEVFQEALGVLRERLSLPASTPTPPCLGERVAVARTRASLIYGLRHRLIDDPQGHRPLGERCDWFPDKLCRDAADEIERLCTENETLRAEVERLKKLNNTYRDEAVKNLNTTLAGLNQGWSDRVLTAEAERDAAIARAEEAEKTVSERAEYIIDLEHLSYIRADLTWRDEATCLRTKLAQAEGEIATAQEALRLAEGPLSWLARDLHGSAVVARALAAVRAALSPMEKKDA